MNKLFLDALFHLNNKKEFLLSKLGNSANYFKGEKNQYAKLLHWPIVNEILIKRKRPVIPV